MDIYIYACIWGSIEEMITRSKLAEQLREHQKRSQHKYSALTVFSPKPHIKSWGDVAIASMWAFLFCVILVSTYATLNFRYFRLSFVIVCIGVLLSIRLRNSPKKLVRKRDLPLSM